MQKPNGRITEKQRPKSFQMNVFNRTDTKQQHLKQTQSRGEYDSHDKLHKSYSIWENDHKSI